MRVGSLCSGVEGFGLGFEQVGMEIAWQCEIDPVPRSILAYHYPEVPCHDDIRTLGGSDLEPVDIIIGGTPCTDLSVSGRRAGIHGEHSGLFFDFARILSEVQPEWFVWENVRGALSSNHGEDFRTVLEVLDDLGYGLAWRLLSAEHFGVPQRRERVFVVGHLGDGTGPAEVLALAQSSGGDLASSRQAQSSDPRRSTQRSGDNRIIRALTTQDDAQLPQPIAFHLTQGPTSGPFSPSMSCDNQQECATIGVMAFSENQQAELVEHRHVHALTSGGGKPGQGYAAIRQEATVRRLTPRECERLMGWPDDWTRLGVDGYQILRIPDNSRYKCIGNGVATPVAREIAERITAFSLTSGDPLAHLPVGLSTSPCS